jgi:hypothetical protein
MFRFGRFKVFKLLKKYYLSRNLYSQFNDSSAFLLHDFVNIFKRIILILQSTKF